MNNELCMPSTMGYKDTGSSVGAVVFDFFCLFLPSAVLTTRPTSHTHIASAMVQKGLLQKG
jgi:hypothetical protein